MKKIYLIATFITCMFNIAKAQTDLCKDIKVTDDKTMSYIGYHSPLTEAISVGAEIDRDGTHKLIHLMFSVFNKTANYNAAGLYVIFADGSIWKDESVDIHCSYFDIDHGYEFGALTGLDNEDDIKMFETKKIKSIKVGTLPLNISDEYAIRFMAYVKCIHDLKSKP